MKIFPYTQMQSVKEITGEIDDDGRRTHLVIVNLQDYGFFDRPKEFTYRTERWVQDGQYAYSSGERWRNADDKDLKPINKKLCLRLNRLLYERDVKETASKHNEELRERVAKLKEA